MKDFARRHKRWLLAGIALVLLLVAIRIALPTWVRDWANAQMAQMGPYQGHVQDVDLQLWRGAYTLHALEVTKRNEAVQVPFIEVPRLQLAIAWRELLRGRIVAVATLWQPEVNFVDSRDGATQSGLGVNWRRELEALTPIELNDVTIHDGQAWFHNFTSSPPVDLGVSDIDAVVHELHSRPDEHGHKARFELTGLVLDQAPLTAGGSFDPLAWTQEFRFRLHAEEVALAGLNEFLQAYARIDVESGEGEFLMELDGYRGHLAGYAKPLFQDVQVFSWEHDVEAQGDSPLRALWEAIAGGLENLFKNQELDQIATRVAISGEIGKPEASALQAIAGIIRNAFVEAYRPLFENLPERPDEPVSGERRDAA